MEFSVRDATQGVIDQTHQFFGGAFHGQVEVGGLVFDHLGLMAVQTGFEGALLDFRQRLFAAVFVTQVNLHACDVAAESLQCVLERLINPLGAFLIAFDVFVGVDLYLHIHTPRL